MARTYILIEDEAGGIVDIKFDVVSSPAEDEAETPALLYAEAVAKFIKAHNSLKAAKAYLTSDEESNNG